jgi:hypothetical protein
MTEQQEKILLKHSPSIRARSGSPDVLNEIVPLYRELSGDANFRVKPGCRGCIEDLLNYLNMALLRHEKQQQEERQAVKENTRTAKRNLPKARRR